MTDKFDRDFLEEFRSRCKEVNKPKEENINVINEPVEVPVQMQVNKGTVYSVYKRSNLYHNTRVIFNIPLEEAIFWASILNEREIKKRSLLSQIPNEVFIYEVVEKDSPAENIFWNSKTIIKGE